MGRIVEEKISFFDGGMTDEKYLGNYRYARLIKNFDGHTYSKKLIPFRSSESGDNNASTSQKQNFCIALGPSSSYKLFALGVVSGTARAEILYKNLNTSGAPDLSENTWTNTANYQSASNAIGFNCFVYYAKTARIYALKTNGDVLKYDPTGSAAITEQDTALSTITNHAQGLVHSKDDILYIPYDNKIASNNNGSWTAAAITLPTHLYITSICEYGNYLAIGAAPLSDYGSSVVYLWDRNATLTTLSESIDWGEGTLRVLEQVEGRLIGISYVGISGSALTGKMIFREYSGGVANVFQQFTSETTFSTTDLTITKQKVNNFLYFQMKIKLNGVTQQGLWKLGRLGADKPFSITMDRTPNNDTALSSSGTLTGFFLTGDYVFMSYSDGSYALTKTDDQANYNATAYYQTLIINAGDSSLLKKLLNVTLTYEAQPTAGSVTVGYRKDAETTYTTILTDTTDNAISDSAINIESSGAILPEFKEIDFQVQSTGGTVITGIKIKYEILDKNLS